jgi:hypothetical protein
LCAFVITGKEDKTEGKKGKGVKIVEYAKPPVEEEEDEDDDGLKCAICYDLCVRPVTVSLIVDGLMCWYG